MAKTKSKDDKIAINVLIAPEQKAALDELGRANERSIGFLVREAINQYLANLKKKG